MKKLIILFTAVMTWVLLTPSCDIVEEPYLKPTGSSGPGPGETVRKVLLEDYTGHKCPNCPEAADLANSLEHIYHNQIILLTVHAGFYSTPDATGEFTNDLRTVTGTEMHDYFGFYAYPSGLVNRSEYKGNRILFISDWEGALEEQVNKPAQAAITLSNTYEPGSRTLTCKTETEFLETMDGTYNICVFIVESDIISPQKDEQGVIEDYVHNHVLRASMNGTWGEPVGASGSGTTGVVQENEYNYVLPAEWDADNCAVIAFVYDEATKEVVQAEELGLEQ
jgi:hypothetical protein